MKQSIRSRLIEQGTSTGRAVVIEITSVPLPLLPVTTEEKIVFHYVVGHVKRVHYLNYAQPRAVTVSCPPPVFYHYGTVLPSGEGGWAYPRDNVDE